MQVTYVVNMNRPGLLPPYDNNDFDLLSTAADAALDLADEMERHGYVSVAKEHERMIDAANGIYIPNAFPMEITLTHEDGIHDRWVVFVDVITTPEM